ncbi:predicted protein [Naegleria gruberi]|uniref:Predicted protein n=1 Tax=Naegleria gruberi TaxID=5762 RepID=D2V596_NAEGR|nr:uncharacterized protein NAEGRDRAFT_46815 [Naegleria gruberi]EFC48072.1 predicted protein [Naegleria gruberi]|eukprot:XP_002680816.1 predicted protein [Naegleria gruberi strain NEG-M]
MSKKNPKKMSSIATTVHLVDFHPTLTCNHLHLFRQFMMQTQSRKSTFLRLRTDALLLGGYHLRTLRILLSQVEDEFRKELLDDEQVMSKYVDFDGRLYFWASDRLKDDFNFIKRAVQQNGMLILSINEGHLSRDLMMTAVQEDGLAIKAGFDSDLEICRQAVKSNGLAFDYISGDMVNNEIANLAFDDNPFDDRCSYLITDEHVRNKVALHCGILTNDVGSNFRKEIIEEVLKISPFSQHYLYQFNNLSEDEIFDLTKIAIQYAGDVDEIIRLDDFTIEQCEELVKYEGNILGLIEDEDQTREMIQSAVRNCGTSLNFANKELVDDEIILDAIKQDPQAIQFTKYDSNFILDRVRENGEVLAHIHEEQQFGEDREIVLAAVSNYGMALGYASGELQDDEEIVMAAVSNCGVALEFADNRLRGRPDFVLKAVSENGLALEFALIQNEEIVTTALNQCVFAFSFVEPQWVTKEIAIMAIKRCPYLFKEENMLHVRDREVTLCAVAGFGGNLQFAADEFKSDSEVVMIAVSNCGSTLSEADEDLQDDYEIVKAAIMNNPSSLDFASDRLKLDWSLLRLYKELQDADLFILNSWEDEFGSTLKRYREEEDDLLEGR